MTWHFPSLLLVTLLLALPGMADPIFNPPLPPLPPPPQELLQDWLDLRPVFPELPDPIGGTWIYTWDGSQWSVQWVPDGGTVFVGDPPLPGPFPDDVLDYPLDPRNSDFPATHTPEPSTWLTIAGGLIALSLARHLRGTRPTLRGERRP